MKAQLGEPTINQVITGGRRRLHYLYPDNTECVEEMDLKTSEVLGKIVRWLSKCDECSEEMEEA